MTIKFARRLCFILAGLLAFGVVFREMTFYNNFPAPTRAVLEGSMSTTVFALDPDIDENGDYCEKKPGACFHGYPVTGSVITAENPASELYKLWRPIPSPALCFIPHHGVRVTRNGHTADFVLCFHCSRGQQWYDSKEGQTFGMSGSSAYFDIILGPKAPPQQY